MGDLGSIPGLGRSPGKGKRLPTPVFWPGEFHALYSPWGCKELDMLSDLTFTFHFHALEKEMATHSTVLAWRIPGTGKPGWLPSMGLHRVRHD